MTLAKKGVGIAFLHYALDPGKEYGQYLLDWIGGYYEQFWSVNPSWLAEFKALPDHPITRGVKPFQVHDEWYYHMRFVEDMEGVTPILTAVPPDSTRKGPDGPHSGNPDGPRPHGDGRSTSPGPTSGPDGGRGFGFTGGHTHWVYAQNDFRKLILNAICWIAGVEVPPDGVATKTPTAEQMEANLQGDRPGPVDPRAHRANHRAVEPVDTVAIISARLASGRPRRRPAPNIVNLLRYQADRGEDSGPLAVHSSRWATGPRLGTRHCEPTAGN